MRPSFSTMVKNFPYARQYHRSDFIWDQLGGKLKELHDSNKALYYNTCALRMSWDLNNSGIQIPSGNTYKGADQRNYFISVDKLNSYLQKIWGRPDIIWQGDIRPKVDELTLKKQQREKILKHKGLIHFSADGHRSQSEFGASGHLDLWNGKECIDEEYFGKYISAVRLWKLP